MVCFSDSKPLHLNIFWQPYQIQCENYLKEHLKLAIADIFTSQAGGKITVTLADILLKRSSVVE